MRHSTPYVSYVSESVGFSRLLVCPQLLAGGGRLSMFLSSRLQPALFGFNQSWFTGLKTTTKPAEAGYVRDCLALSPPTEETVRLCGGGSEEPEISDLPALGEFCAEWLSH